MTKAAPIIHFSADRTLIRPGECATLRWHVEGVKEVYFFAKGQGWQGHGVVGAGEQQVCPSQTTTYRLRVIKRDDSVEVRKIEIQVQAQTGSQVVQVFSADRVEIQPGECVTFRWRVEGVKAVYFFPEGAALAGPRCGRRRRAAGLSLTDDHLLPAGDQARRLGRRAQDRVQVQAQTGSQVVQIFSVRQV